MYKISGFYDESSSSFDNQIELIKKLGESYLCPRKLNGKNIADYTLEEFEKDIKPKLVENGIKFSSIGSPLGKINLDDEEGFEKQKKQLLQLIKICKSIDCKYIRIFSFYVDTSDNPEQYQEKVVEKLKEFVKIAEGSDVILMHENEKKIFGDVPERCIYLYKTINHPQFKLCYDASNYIQCDCEPYEAYKSTKEFTVYYHIKDCNAKSKSEVPVGFGQGKYPKMLKDLIGGGYDGFLTMEPHTFK